MDNGSILSNVGANIRMLRKRKKLTIDELAEMASLSGKYLQGVEVGTRNISIKNLNKIVIALESNLQYLVSRSCGDVENKEAKIFVISEKLKHFDMPKLDIIGNMLENIDIVLQEKNKTKANSSHEQVK